MPDFSDFTTADWTSIIIAGISALICLAALITALAIGRRDSKHRFEIMVEECLMPISIFIEDSFWIISEKRFRSASYVDEGEKKLIEGLHKLQVFATTNKYKFLNELAKISYGRDQKEKNEKCFSYCLLKLENIYIQYRKKHVSGKITDEDKGFLEGINVLFQDYLAILATYMFGFRRKRIFFRKCFYYKKLKTTYEENQKYVKFAQGKSSTAEH